MTFETILLIIAKIGFSLFFVLFLIRWFLIIPYLLFRYDRPIIRLKKELDEFRKKERTRPAPMSLIELRINNKTREIAEKLDILETQRGLFLDKVNLLLSIVSVDKK